MIDVFTRECLALTVARRLRSSDVTAALNAVIAERGRPAALTVACYVSLVKRRFRETRWGVQSSN